MSILSEAWHNIQNGMAPAKVWDTASTEVETYITQQANKNPAAADALSATESVVKQGLSDALSVADSALGKHAMPVAKAVEDALEAALASATGGLSTPFNAIIDAGLDDIAGIAVTAAHAWTLKTKARLAAQPPAQPAPPQQGS